MRYLLLLILLIATPLWSADVIYNGKVGTVIAPTKPILDTTYYKVVEGIPENILMGRAIIDAHRKRKADSYSVAMKSEDRAATNLARVLDMRSKLKEWGFKDEADLIDQSTALDTALWQKDHKYNGWWK